MGRSNKFKFAVRHHSVERGCVRGWPRWTSPPAQYEQVSRRHRRLVHRTELRQCTGAWGPSAANKLRLVYTGALLAITITPHKKEWIGGC